MTIIKATSEHLSECTEAVINSQLGKEYFSAPGSAEGTLRTGIEHGEVYVAVENDICTGFIWIIPNGAFHSFPYIHIIAVREEFRDKGIGKELLSFAETKSERGKIFLAVGDFNPDAMHLYESIGYVRVGVIPDLYKKNDTNYLMMKVI